MLVDMNLFRAREAVALLSTELECHYALFQDEELLRQAAYVQCIQNSVTSVHALWLMAAQLVRGSPKPSDTVREVLLYFSELHPEWF